MAELDPPPRYNTNFLSHVWQEWFRKAWTKTKIKILETNGNPARGSAAPVDTFLNSVSGLKFAVGDSVYFNFEMPHDWVVGTDIEFIVHSYSSNTVAGRYVHGNLTWQSAAVGETITAPTSSGVLDSGDVLLGTTANMLGKVQFPKISGSALAQNDHVFLKLERVVSIGTAPASPADNPVLVHFNVEYTANLLRAE